MYNGILNIYKEKGFTSFDVCAKLRGVFHQKKIGHTGTLDPLAEGVLVVLLGSATRLSEMLTSDHKEYEAVMKLGETSDTDDIAGKITETEGFEARETLSDEEIEAAVMSFVGSYDQLPPLYAAIKVGGKKLYEYAREGIEVERQPRNITIHDIKMIDISYPYVRFYVKCSKGTYIRSLCRDIGEKLGTGALMADLIRREAGDFRIEDSLKISEVEELVREGRVEDAVKPIDFFLRDIPAAKVKDGSEGYLLNGNKLSPEMLEMIANDGVIEENNAQHLAGDSCDEDSVRDNKMLRVYFCDEFKALYSYDEKEKLYRPYKMFL